MPPQQSLVGACAHASGQCPAPPSEGCRGAATAGVRGGGRETRTRAFLSALLVVEADY